MLIELKKGDCSLTVDTMGAEIRSLKKKGKEFFWQREKNPDGSKIWGSTAPNLFPMVGPSRILEKGIVKEAGAYKLAGAKYLINQHGFIRDTDAEIVRQTPDSLRLIIQSSSETLERYPFDFNYFIDYALTDKGLVNKTVTVFNTGDKDMPFNIGDHEGFALEDDIEKYYLRFDRLEDDKTERHGKQIIQKSKDGKRSIIPFNKEMFLENIEAQKEKALQFSNIKSKYATIVKKGEKGKKDEEIVTMKLDAPKFLLWSKPPFKFVCPEPWHGTPLVSTEEKDAEFSLSLKPGEKFVLEREIFAHAPQKEREF